MDLSCPKWKAVAVQTVPYIHVGSCTIVQSTHHAVVHTYHAVQFNCSSGVEPIYLVPADYVWLVVTALVPRQLFERLCQSTSPRQAAATGVFLHLPLGASWRVYDVYASATVAPQWLHVMACGWSSVTCTAKALHLQLVSLLLTCHCIAYHLFDDCVLNSYVNT